MNPVGSMIAGLNPRYFWDVDFTKLNGAASEPLIIERIFSLGEIHEMNQVIRYYGRDKVVEVLCNLPYIDRKTLNFLTLFFDKPPEAFRCYQKKQSKTQHWDL